MHYKIETVREEKRREEKRREEKRREEKRREKKRFFRSFSADWAGPFVGLRSHPPILFPHILPLLDKPSDPGQASPRATQRLPYPGAAEPIHLPGRRNACPTPGGQTYAPPGPLNLGPPFYYPA